MSFQERLTQLDEDAKKIGVFGISLTCQEIQMHTNAFLERFPEDYTITVKPSSSYPIRLSQEVDGWTWFTILDRDEAQNLARKGVISRQELLASLNLDWI